jgi:hypothetical protein
MAADDIPTGERRGSANGQQVPEHRGIHNAFCGAGEAACDKDQNQATHD